MKVNFNKNGFLVISAENYTEAVALKAWSKNTNPLDGDTRCPLIVQTEVEEDIKK